MWCGRTSPSGVCGKISCQFGQEPYPGYAREVDNVASFECIQRFLLRVTAAYELEREIDDGSLSK